MFITITNASKGKPHRLLEQVDGCQIGIKKYQWTSRLVQYQRRTRMEIHVSTD